MVCAFNDSPYGLDYKRIAAHVAYISHQTGENKDRIVRVGARMGLSLYVYT